VQSPVLFQCRVVLLPRVCCQQERAWCAQCVCACVCVCVFLQERVCAYVCLFVCVCVWVGVFIIRVRFMILNLDHAEIGRGDV